jgi:hypothetical protein
MDSWELTLIVLKDLEAFCAYFINSPLLTDPKFLFELNSVGFSRKNLVSTVNSGAGMVNDAITDMKRDISDFCKEQTENNNLVQRHVTAIHTTLENQSNTVALIGNQLHQFRLSLLSGRDEKAIEGKIAIMDNSLNFETHCLHMSDDPADSITIKQTILDLKADRRKQVAFFQVLLIRP